MKAAIYSRFSTDRQNESSITDQERVCSEYAARQGWEITERYSDAHISGAAMGNRPGFLRMRADAMSGKFDVLLVADTTRLARSQELAPLIDRFRFQRVRVIGVQDSFDSDAGTSDMQAGLSGIMSVEFRRMIKARTHTALESRARQKRATGGKLYGYDSQGKVVEQEAAAVREIFTMAGEGASCRTIAATLNRRGVPSPGASWRRSERRSSGWMGSAIRALLLNPRFRGEIIWNKSRWDKDPDSGKRICRERPRTEWVVHHDELRRIVSDAAWSAVQRRLKPMPDDVRLKTGGKPRYLLSGLLRCDVCGARYVLGDVRSYVCSSFINGAACSNDIRVRRDHAEQVLLAPIRDELLAPERVARMAQEMEAYYQERLRLRSARATDAPRELRELEARIARLRERLERGDPDLAADELLVAIERAEAKRTELLAATPDGKVTFKLVARLNKAGSLYRQQIVEGVAGDPRAAAKARVILRELFCGEIRLVPQADGGLLARWNLQPAALLRGAGTCGSGGPLVSLFAADSAP
jgi:site-specific DNA recombinase